MKTSEKLRRRRGELGLTQYQVAEKAEMSVVQYNGYENDRHEPSEATMVRLAKALKAKADDLWDDAYTEEETVTSLKEALRKKVAEALGIDVKGVRVRVDLM